MTKFYNAFMLTDSVDAVTEAIKNGADRVVLATSRPELFVGIEQVEAYKFVKSPDDANEGRIFLPSLKNEDIVDAVTENVLGCGAKLIVAANRNLDEIGLSEARFHLTPVQILHKLGLLDRCTVVGGVYLDRDDVELLSQENTPLVLCPTCSLGYGDGFPHVSALDGKVDFYLGSGDGAFNAGHSILRELRALILGSNCEMRQRDSFSVEALLSRVCPTLKIGDIFK